MRRYLLLFFTLLVLASLQLSAENIRGPVSGYLSLEGERSVKTKAEHLIGIGLEGFSPLIQGFRLSVFADDEMEIYRNSFALYLYKNLNAPFDTENNSYKGSQALMRFLTFSEDLNLLIPLTDNHTLSPDRSSYILADRDNSNDFPLILTILPISKGIPDAAYNREIRIELEPVYFEKGQVQLNIFNDRGEVLEEGVHISIDNKSYPWPGGPYTLSSGLHNITIRSEDGNEESRSFTLEAGQILSLDHVVQYQLPLLSIETIEGLEVYLDGKLIKEEDLEERFEIQPGGHSIRFELGDFIISRDFVAEMQQRISITMIPEILLEYRD